MIYSDAEVIAERSRTDVPRTVRLLRSHRRYFGVLSNCESNRFCGRGGRFFIFTNEVQGRA